MVNIPFKIKIKENKFMNVYILPKQKAILNNILFTISTKKHLKI